MKYLPKQAKTKLATAVFLAVASVNASAVTIDLSLSADSSVTVNSVTTNGPSSSATAANANTAGYYKAQSHVNNYGVGGSAYSHAKSDSDGSFATWSSSDNAASGSGAITQSYTVTNDDAIDQDFLFDFTVTNGSISAYCNGFGEEGDHGYGYGTGCASGDFQSASYQANIFLDGISIWDSSATITENEFGYEFADTGSTSLGTYNSGGHYWWGVQNYQLDLGTILAGDSFVLDYVVSVNTSGSGGASIPDVGIDGQFFEILGGRSYAQFGDPNGFSSNANSISSKAANVPEPATFALFASGLLSFGLMRRRKRLS